jgi:peptidoglycan-associated lipoprotein
MFMGLCKSRLIGMSMAVLLASCASHEDAAPTAPPASAPQAEASAPPPSANAAAPAPAGVVPGSLADFQTNVGDRVIFDYDRWELTQGGRDTLQRQAAWLQRYPAVTLIVEGHCDERGTREYNLALGARRAQAVRDYLASLGVSAARLETISFGKERPTCVETNEACWQQNRRGVSTIKSGAAT